jgi:hypothetical protein
VCVCVCFNGRISRYSNQGLGGRDHFCRKINSINSRMLGIELRASRKSTGVPLTDLLGQIASDLFYR